VLNLFFSIIYNDPFDFGGNRLTDWTGYLREAKIGHTKLKANRAESEEASK